MLRVPLYRQPDAVTCLPTCVRAVLDYRHGEGSVTHDEIVEACCLDCEGAIVDIAIQGLLEAGWDLDLLTYHDLASIKERVDTGDPVILIRAQSSASTRSYGHAVVVCALDDAGITVMDPAVGEYVSLSLADDPLLETEIVHGFSVAGVPALNAR